MRYTDEVGWYEMRHKLGTGNCKQLSHDQQQNADLDKTGVRGI